MLARFLSEVSPEGVVAAREVHAIKAGHETLAYERDIRAADVILSQPIKDDYRKSEGFSSLSLEWIRENKRPGSTLITFPSIYYRGYQPQSFAIHPIKVFPSLVYHDAHLINMYIDGVTAVEAAYRCQDRDFLSPDFVRAEADASLANLAKREADENVDVTVSDIINEDRSQHALFATFNHPLRRLLVRMLEKVSAAVDIPLPRREGRELALRPFAPIYPAVAEALNLGPSVRQHVGVVHTTRGDFPFEVFTRMLFDHLADCYQNAEDVRVGLKASPEAWAYLARYRSALA